MPKKSFIRRAVHKLTGLDAQLEELVKIGLIERLLIDGETVYHITPQGDHYVETVLMKKGKYKKPHTLRDLV